MPAGAQVTDILEPTGRQQGAAVTRALRRQNGAALRTEGTGERGRCRAAHDAIFSREPSYARRFDPDADGAARPAANAAVAVPHVTGRSGGFVADLAAQAMAAQLLAAPGPGLRGV